MSYDKKYRQRAMEYWSAGHNKRATAEVFKVTDLINTKYSCLRWSFCCDALLIFLFRLDFTWQISLQSFCNNENYYHTVFYNRCNFNCWRTSSKSKGLPTCPFMPEARHFSISSRKTLAVIAMIGMTFALGISSARIRCVAS